MAATTSSTSHQNNPFIKSLAANDRQIRDRALTQLKSFLSRSTPFTSTDQLRLWKGLFYTMWSADKPRYQQSLARNLASLTLHFSTPENTTSFLRAFWETMSREWNNIEVLRMDKFLYLVRQFLSAGFEWLASLKPKWGNKEEREQVLDILMDFPLNARDVRVPNGLRYHVIDIYIDELDKADTERDAPVEDMLRPLRKLAKDSPTKTIRERVKEALDDGRVRDWKGENKGDEDEAEDEQASDDDDNDEFGGFDD